MGASRFIRFAKFAIAFCQENENFVIFSLANGFRPSKRFQDQTFRFVWNSLRFRCDKTAVHCPSLHWFGRSSFSGPGISRPKSFQWERAPRCSQDEKLCALMKVSYAHRSDQHCSKLWNPKCFFLQISNVRNGPLNLDKLSKEIWTFRLCHNQSANHNHIRSDDQMGRVRELLPYVRMIQRRGSDIIQSRKWWLEQLAELCDRLPFAKKAIKKRWTSKYSGAWRTEVSKC